MTRKTSWFLHVAGAAALAAATSAAAVGVAETPLFVSTGAAPNVMLLMDNSGSMDNVIWHGGYDDKLTYPDWSGEYDFNGDGIFDENWTANNGNVLLAQMVGCSGTSFANDYKVGRRAGITRCLRLPDPVGGNATRYSGNYLNYLFATFGVDGATVTLIAGEIPNITRMTVARNVGSNIVNNNANLRIGLAAFNPPISGEGAPGGRVRNSCGSTTSALLSGIAALRSEANTPLAETYYEVTRYFRGLPSQYNANTTYSSPIQYRCQKNFVAVVTDGFPTWDTQFPANDPADVADSGRTLPDWDGLAPPTQPADYPLFPQYSDGYAAGQPAAQGEGRTLFLDDIAKFGFDLDLRIGGNDNAGVSFDAPPYRIQNLSTYTVGFAVANQMLQDAAQYGSGIYYTANNEAQLNTALQAAFKDIIDKTSSAASVATNSTRLSADTFIYQARFSTGDWSGQLLAFPINSDGSVGAPAWDAASLIPPPAQRKIFTYDPTAPAGIRGKDFLWSTLNAGQQAELDKNDSGVADGLGQKRLAYLRGDRSNEAPGGAQFRARSVVLGDIVNSDPLFVGRQDFGFDRLPGVEGGSYEAFRASAAYQGRPGTLYVGSNDGMLHAFDATTGGERFAFVPNTVYPRLSLPTSPAYNTSHKYLVDGSARAVDAYLNGAWETVLLGALGAGGRGVFALRVTDPVAFGADDVLWEFDSANDIDMGLSLPQTSIARMNNGRWAAIVANGYNSGGQKAVLFILDLATGAVIRKIDTGVAGDNGLSSPIPVDVDRDRITDFIYAGDLKGNLWKFDVTAANANQWDVAFKQGSTPLPLFSACASASSSCPAGTQQPITVRPEVGLNPKGGFIVHFGTGRYFATGDTTLTTPVNSFYGIFDPNDKGVANPQPVGAGRGQLLEQRVLGTQTIGSENVRLTTNNQLTDAHRGFFIDLPETGERQVSTPLLRGGRIIFTTVTPNSDPCGFGGTSWLMELDAQTGSRLSFSPFDLNRDRQFNHADFGRFGDEAMPVSGRQSREGIIKTPGVITAGELEFKYASGTTGGIDTTVENSAGAGGRQSWRQVQ